MRRRLLLVGAGRWGKIFLRNLAAHPRARCAGLVTSQARANLPEVGAETELFPELEYALRKPWDGVILATPPELHASQLQLCTAAGLPVLVEKPLTLSLEAARALGEQPRVLVDHLFLFHPGYEWLKANVPASAIRAIESEGGSLGPYRKGYSPLWDYGAHDLSMILDLIGEDPRTVTGAARELDTIEGGLAGTYEMKLEFRSGVRASFRSSNRLAQKTRRLRLETSAGTYVLDDVPAPRLTGPTGEIPLPPHRPVKEVLRVFAQGIEGHPDSRWGLSLGLRVLAALESCERAVRA